MLRSRALLMVGAGLLLACQQALAPGERAIPRELPIEEREAARRLPFEGAHNFRDLGGYEAIDGRRVKWGVLYRSDALGDLSGDDVTFMSRLGLRRVIDFRSPPERERAPDQLPEGPEGPMVVLSPIFGEGLDPRALQDRILSGDATAEQLSRLLVEGNRAFVTEFGAQYRGFLEGLTEAENFPTLFHCTAGKDRAGFAAAVALMAVGVPRETVMRDYLLTNGYTAEHTDSTLRLIRLASLFRADPEAVRPLFEARRSYLQAAFDTIDSEYGSTDAYLRAGLGLDDDARERLRANLLE